MKTMKVRIFQVLVILVFLFGSANLKPVLAQDNTPAPTDPVAVVEVVTPGPASVTDAPATEVPATEEVPVPPTEVSSAAPTTEPTAGPTEEELATVADSVDTMASKDLVLLDPAGNPLPMASIETQETLASNDPWFEDPSDSTKVIAYQTSCPVPYIPPSPYTGGTCNVSSTPIQDAIDDAPNGATIHIEAATFAEQVDIDNRVLTIAGAGTGTILTAPSSVVDKKISGDSYYSLIYVHNNSNVTLSNLTFNGTGFPSPSNNSIITGLLIQASSANVSNVTVSNFTNPDSKVLGAGMVLDSITGTNIVNLVNNTFANNEIGLLRLGVPNNINLTGNIFSGNGQDVLDMGKITICHSTGSTTNPFNKEEIAQELVVTKSKKTGLCELNGHGLDKNDVIPAFTGVECSFAGQGDPTFITNGCGNSTPTSTATVPSTATATVPSTATATVPSTATTTVPSTATATVPSTATPTVTNTPTETVTPTPTATTVSLVPPAIPVTGGAPAALVIPVTGGQLIPVTGGTLIVSGLGHSCMTYNDGQVICWGLNASGQLGDGTNTNESAPIYVKDLNGVLNLTAGSKHTCALTISGEILCWGENGSGQLGNGTTTNSNVPVKVTGLPGKVLSITAGEEFTCAQLMNQDVWCWGKNDLGQLNDGTTTNQNKPVKSELTTMLAQISGGQGLLLGSDVLGTVNQWAKVQAAAVQQVAGSLSISANRWGATGCAVTSDGTVKCWGSNLISAPVKDALPALEVGAGLAHNCDINTDETVSCWGTNTSGQLGNGTFTDSISATLVKNLAKAHALAVGANHTCILSDTSNTAWCWGENTFGQLGNNTTTNSNVPVLVIMPAS